MVAFLVLSIISTVIGTIINIIGVITINAISAHGGFSGEGFNVSIGLFCLIFVIGLVQEVAACVASGSGCYIIFHKKIF